MPGMFNYKKEEMMENKELKVSEKTEVRSWYHVAYPHDGLWVEILPDYTFEGLFKALDRRMFSYVLFGNDSVIRERILCKLAEVMKVPMEEVFEQFYSCKCVDSKIWGDTRGMAEAIHKMYEIMS